MQLRETLFLSLMVTNCSGEKSFSRFKRIKNELKGHNVPEEVVYTIFLEAKILEQKLG